MSNIFIEKKYWIDLLGINGEDIPETMIIYGSWFFDKKIFLLEKKIKKESDTLLPNLKIGTANKKKFFYGVAYGPTMAGELSHLAGVLKVKKIILIGTCGGLYNGKNLIIVPKQALRNDGVSDWYLKKNILPKVDSALFKRAKKYFAKNNLNIETGKTLTIANMLMETDALIKQWREKKIKAIDLETATVYSIANYFKIRCISILLESEKLIDNKRVITETNKKNKIKETIIDCAINL